MAEKEKFGKKLIKAIKSLFGVLVAIAISRITKYPFSFSVLMIKSFSFRMAGGFIFSFAAVL